MASPTFQVRVARKTIEAEGVAGFELVDRRGAALPPFSAGSHIDVHVPGGPIRQYSLCNDPREAHRYLIAVLRDPASRGGSAGMHDGVDEGALLTIGVPRNHFELSPAATHSVLIAGGIGVTPILSMAEHLDAADTSFEMHYCTRSHERTAFAGRLAQASYSARVRHYVGATAADNGFDPATILAASRPGHHLYVCGPQGFIDAILGTARAAGWPPEQLHCEFFGVAPPSTHANDRFEVRIASSGRCIEIAPDQTVARALEAAGVTVPVACEQGVCGTCLTRVLEGIPDHRDQYLTTEERAAGDQFLPCCSRSRTPVLVLQL